MKTLLIGDVRSKRYTRCKDFIVSGKSILQELDRRGFDLAPTLWNGAEPVGVELRDALLCDPEKGAISGYASLYGCPQCGDCSSIGVRIEKATDTITWTEFIYNDPVEDHPFLLDRLGPFKFDLKEYRKAIL